jgi:flagellin-like hook-associated protein FlgL
VANTHYDGDQLVQSDESVASLFLDPNDLSKTLEISFADVTIIDTTALEIEGSPADQTEAGALGLIDEQYGNALSYLAEVSGYLRSVDAHTAITDSIMQNEDAYESTINRVNDAEELNRVVSNDIRQQASLAMLSQASMYRMGVLSLLK